MNNNLRQFVDMNVVGLSYRTYQTVKILVPMQFYP